MFRLDVLTKSALNAAYSFSFLLNYNDPTEFFAATAKWYFSDDFIALLTWFTQASSDGT